MPSSFPSHDYAPFAPSASASQRADESDLDPAAFLKSVRELSEKREREDNERYRKLEEEIEKSRADRAARRAERARSISPQKGTPSTPSTRRAPTDIRTTDSPIPRPVTPIAATSAAMDDHSVPSPSAEIPEFKGFGSTSRAAMPPTSATNITRLTDTPEPAAAAPPQSATSLARSGTLSWQQRPSSRGAMSRPRSMISSSTSVKSTPTPTDEPEPSRDQIAASLGARDPSWFRQTPDRGVGSAAYRKIADDTMAGENAFASGRRGLPGMQREVPSELARNDSPAAPSPSISSETPSSYTTSGQDAVSRSSQFSTIRTSTSSKPDLKSLIAQDQEQDKASPMSERISRTTNVQDSGISRTPTMSSSQARLAGTIERPGSPTKGMGGFVQSAMMKRSDSVNKRWSAQPAANLSRQDSASSSRSGVTGLAGSHSMPKIEPLAANDSKSKPGHSSAHNLTTLASSTDDVELPEARPMSPPSSPSKRWSPTKSTWLESAISRPESPKPPSARNSQPSWMADIAKAKAQRAGNDSVPQQAEDNGSRSASPTRQLFGQDGLRRSESKDLGSPQSSTPRPISAQGYARPPSPLKMAVEATKPPDVGTESAAPSTITQQASTASRAVPSVDLASKPTVQATSSPMSKPKPEPPAKPQTDFRSTLRPRQQSEAKQEEVPEFLSKFGALRKTTTQNYVAPDILKGNILRGKAELSKTDGPVKSERRDELKESLLAKKEQWKKDKDEGIVHERKTSQPPIAPQKPEALAKREVLGKTESTAKTSARSDESTTSSMPEALVRQKSMRGKSVTDTALPALQKQTSAPVSAQVDQPLSQLRKQTSTPSSSSSPVVTPPVETSRMAAKFNPGLAGILARGPPASNSGSSGQSRSGETAARPTPSQMSAAAESTESGQLQDMRKGRAKGPKKRKAGTKEAEPESATSHASIPAREPGSASRNDLLIDANVVPAEEQAMPVRAMPVRAKPQALPGSAASVMMASLQRSSDSTPSKPATPVKNRNISGPRPYMGSSPASTPNNKPALPSKPDGANVSLTSKSPAVSSDGFAATAPKDAPTSQSDIPDFAGFGSVKRSTPAAMRLVDDDKENVGEGSPSVKPAASQWGRQPPTRNAELPAQIKLPSKKDEEAAMRSAGLLASSSSRPSSRSGPVISNDGSNSMVNSPSAGAPPKPVKSSRAVSGQLPEASSPTKSTLGWGDASKNAIERQLRQALGTVPKSGDILTIDTQAAINNQPHQDRIFKTIRKSVQVALSDGTLHELPHQREYTFFDESIYLFTHAYSVADGPRKTEMFLWSGDSATKAAVESAEVTAKRLAKDFGNAYVHAISQGLEPPGFLQALGGILVTRRGAHQAAAKQFMLRGRHHLGQIVFDEVDFSVDSFHSGFAYLISYPVTLQETRLYLWKGSAASTEEISAARLAAADLSESHEVIEVDDGAEFASFLKIFGPGTSKASIAKPDGVWRYKALAPNTFAARLFRVQPSEAKTGIFSTIFARRPSWPTNTSPTRGKDDIATAKLVAKEISPFTQSDLDADCVYLLDAYSAVYVLVGPAFASQPESVRNLLFGQTLLFAGEYATLAASRDGRPETLESWVLLSGVPADLALLFRHWDDGVGFWGTGARAAGTDARKTRDDVRILEVEDVKGVVCTA